MDMHKLEKSFRTTTESTLQQNIIEYLKKLKEVRFSRLLQENTQDLMVEERNIIRGELRVIQKLLNVLEPKSEFINWQIR